MAFRERKSTRIVKAPPTPLQTAQRRWYCNKGSIVRAEKFIESIIRSVVYDQHYQGRYTQTLRYLIDNLHICNELELRTAKQLAEPYQEAKRKEKEKMEQDKKDAAIAQAEKLFAYNKNNIQKADLAMLAVIKNSSLNAIEKDRLLEQLEDIVYTLNMHNHVELTKVRNS